MDAASVEEEEKANETESKREDEEELDLGDEADFKKGAAFAAALAELKNVLVASDPDEEHLIDIDPVAFATPSKSMRILCKQGRIVVTGGYTPPGPPPKKKNRSMSTAAYSKKGVALIGSTVKLMWPNDGETYGGLILGYQSGDDVHKVYFWCDGSVALLSRRDATFVPDTGHKLRGLV